MIPSQFPAAFPALLNAFAPPHSWGLLTKYIFAAASLPHWLIITVVCLMVVCTLFLIAASWRVLSHWLNSKKEAASANPVSANFQTFSLVAISLCYMAAGCFAFLLLLLADFTAPLLLVPVIPVTIGFYRFTRAVVKSLPSELTFFKFILELIQLLKTKQVSSSHVPVPLLKGKPGRNGSHPANPAPADQPAASDDRLG